MEDLTSKTYIIMAKSTVEVDRLSQRSKLVKLTQEQRVELTEAMKRTLKPLCQYLNQQGLQEGRNYQVLKNLGTVIVSLNPQQAETIRKLPYVKSICEDTEVHLIE